MKKKINNWLEKEHEGNSEMELPITNACILFYVCMQLLAVSYIILGAYLTTI
jgi:hypothetical protein